MQPIIIESQQEVTYNEIQKGELPDAVTSAVAEKYPNWSVMKAYKGSDNSYKLKITMGDQKKAVFYDENGEFLKEKDVEENKG